MQNMSRGGSQLKDGNSIGLVYIGDPMCSWCWGFAPVLDGLRHEFGLPVEVVVGGLRPGPAAVPLDQTMKRFLRREWSRIHEVTGQPFDFSTLDREGWVYDSLLPAIAVAGVRERKPVQTLAFFTRVQQAFYAEAVDVTDPSAYVPLVGGFGLDGEEFSAFLGSPEGEKAAAQDFALAARMGVQGFPTLLFRREDGRLVLLSRGYAAHADLAPVVAQLMTNGAAS